jgi:hypothetical protein
MVAGMFLSFGLLIAIISLASESRDFKKPLESRIFEFHLKLFKYGTLQAKQK